MQRKTELEGKLVEATEMFHNDVMTPIHMQRMANWLRVCKQSDETLNSVATCPDIHEVLRDTIKERLNLSKS